jgi:autotransporter-associated beta strand protein
MRTLIVGNGTADVDLDVSVPITNGGLTKAGSGTMRLSGANTFDGPVTVSGGTLRYNHASGLSSNSLVTVNNGSTLDMNGFSDTIAALASDAGHTTGAVLQGAANLTLAADSGTNTFGGTITGSGTLTKNGNATQILNGNNSLGAVDVNGGALVLNGVNTTGPVTVDGGMLGGAGTISGAVTVNSGAHVSPGQSIESLDVGTLTVNSGAVLNFEIGPFGFSDQINVGGLLTLNGGSINVIDAGGLNIMTYTLIHYGTLGGSVANLGTPTGPAGFEYTLIDTGSSILLDVSAPGLPGDFNGDGAVDAADYVVWRSNETANNPLPNDNGVATQVERFDLWRANFGAMSGGGTLSSAPAGVPEPGSAALVVVAGAMLLLPWGRRDRLQPAAVVADRVRNNASKLRSRG